MTKALRPPRWFAVPLAWLVLSCGGDSEPSDTTRNLSIQGGDNQSATVGAAVATPPSVKVGNSSGTGVANVQVTFAVASGGGTVTGGAQTTNAQGVATVGGWTLGQTSGPNSLTVTVQGSSSTLTVNATGTAAAPAALAKTAGDNQNAAVKAAVATRPAVRVNDQFGNVVPNATVVFTVTAGGGAVTGGTQTTDAQGVATVGGWTLGPTNGVNRLSAAVQGAAAIQPQVFTANGNEIVIQPAADTVFQAGTINLTRLVIAAGRTVTVAGNVIINADSTVEIAGTLQGNCVAITINGGQAVTVSGVINNVCTAPSAAPPDLKIVAKGGYTFTGPGEIRTSGNGEITNDPTLTDADFPASAAALRRASGSALTHVPCHVQKVYRTEPEHADHGADGGPVGGDGKNGKTWVLQCRGADLEMGVGSGVFGQDGGNGGSADHTGDPGDAKGGKGGEGGLIKVRSTGRVIFAPGVVVGSGNGGNGGGATAKGSAGKSGQKAASAKAVGGAGGLPGLIEVKGAQGILGAGNTTLDLGVGGGGGGATAEGADGEVGKSTSAREQDGGDANAEGGDGAGSPSTQLVVAGSVAGGAPALQGGHGGNGGNATADGGNGAAGTEAHPDGGFGGDMKAVGGEGGDALARRPAPPAGDGQLAGDGGDGGKATFKNGNGADGWDNCIDLVRLAGEGGRGGPASGEDGEGGSGRVEGEDGGVTYSANSNGAQGGDHFVAPGEGGAAGGETVNEHGAAVGRDTSFKPGQPGKLCPQQGLIEASQTEHQKTHILAESACVDPFSNVAIVSQVNELVSLQISQTAGPPFLNFSLGSGTLMSHGSTTLMSAFNCGQPQSFMAQLRVRASATLAAPPQGAPGTPVRAAAAAPVVQDLFINYVVTVRARYVRLATALGTLPANTLVPLTAITGGTRFPAHTPNCAVEHLHAAAPAGIMIQGLGGGPFPDPNPTGCGYGEVLLQTLPAP